MGIARSTFYDRPAAQDDTAICEEFEFYGWWRVRAGLRHRGLIVNHKKDPAADARARSPAPPTAPLCRDNQTATTISRSILVAPRTWRLTAPTSFGSQT